MIFIPIKRDEDESQWYAIDLPTLINIVDATGTAFNIQEVDIDHGFELKGEKYGLGPVPGKKGVLMLNQRTHDVRVCTQDDMLSLTAWRILSVYSDIQISNIAKPESTVQPLQATKDLPVAPGSYWLWGRRRTLKGAKHFSLRMVNIEMHNGVLRVADNLTSGLSKGLPVAELKGMSFAGPIPTPVGVI